MRQTAELHQTLAAGVRPCEEGQVPELGERCQARKVCFIRAVQCKGAQASEALQSAAEAVIQPPC